MDRPDKVALAMADACLAGEASVHGLLRACTRVLGKKWPWLPQLCIALYQQIGENFYSFNRAEIASWLLEQRTFQKAWRNPSQAPKIAHYCLAAPIAPALEAWRAELALPSLASSLDLANWLQLPCNDVAWFADNWRQDSATTEQLQHYRYRWLAKKSGGWRLLEMPKPQLRQIQRKILREILHRVPPHAAAHGFRPHHSVLSHASLHCGQSVLMRLDLQDFFGSISAARVHALFRKLAYPESVARSLAHLCTHRTPSALLKQTHMATPTAISNQQHARLRSRHLPQGAPSSPALANLCAYRLDVRVAALAQAMQCRYSRYADDLTLSGGPELAHVAQRLVGQIAAIADEEGFALNFRKTRIMHAAQQQTVTGVVVNQRPNLARAEFDVLKAMLTNCVRHGPESQNRAQHPDFQAYLRGRVAWLQMLNQQRGARLAQLFHQIEWPKVVLAG